MLEEDKALSMAAARAATWRLEERELQALALRSCLLLGAVAVLACWYYLAAQPGRAALFAVTCLASVLLLACYGLARRGAALAPLCWLCALWAAASWPAARAAGGARRRAAQASACASLGSTLCACWGCAACAAKAAMARALLAAGRGHRHVACHAAIPAAAFLVLAAGYGGHSAGRAAAG